MGNLYCALQPKGGHELRLLQLTGGLQENLGPRFELMDEQFHSGIDEYIAFDGGYQPDDNQMFTLQLTDEMQSFAAQMDAGPIGRERYDPNEQHAGHIRALFWCYQVGEYNRILVQNFTKGQAVTQRGFVLSLMDGETFSRLEAPSILVGERIDGVIWNGRFEFRSFHVAKQVFDLREAYREATSQEVQEFLDIPTISAVEDGLADNLNATQRKLVFSIRSADEFENMAIEEVAERANQAGFELPIANGQIQLQGGRELTQTLRFLDNGVYRSPINDRLYMSNSHRRVS